MTKGRDSAAQQIGIRHTARKSLYGLVVIGLGIGWLTGLSVSPVVSTIITSLLGVIITLIGALSGLQALPVQSDEETKNNSRYRWHLDSIPIALFIIGVVIGSSIGIVARSRNWLGIEEKMPDLNLEIKRWEEVGISKEEIAHRLFDIQYPQMGSSKNSGQESDSSEKDNIKSTLLFSQAHEECQWLLSFPSKQLSGELKNSSIEIFRDLPEVIQDPETLREVVKKQCEKLGQ